MALKVFSPERYENDRAYDEAMGRMAVVAAHVAQIQQDNLLDVHNWVDRNRIRLMEMEWVNGYDLSLLLTRTMLEHMQGRVKKERWKYLNEVIVTAGPVQPRLKPGIAMAVVRDCLAALAALHREGIVHGDMKPANIMLKRTGNAKIVDIGSAFEMGNPPARRTCTPTYAAPEVLEGSECTPRSDLASLGYVLIEMLAGQPPFADPTGFRELLEAKRTLAQRLPQILPKEVVCNELLMTFCRRLIARSGPAFPQRRSGRPGQGRRGGLPPPTGQGRPGHRVRQRDPHVAGRAGGLAAAVRKGRPGNSPSSHGSFVCGSSGFRCKTW